MYMFSANRGLSMIESIMVEICELLQKVLLEGINSLIVCMLKQPAQHHLESQWYI